MMDIGKDVKGTTMADRDGLKFVGFIFATGTLAVMLATGMVVKGYADGAYSLEGEPTAARPSTLRYPQRPHPRMTGLRLSRKISASRSAPEPRPQPTAGRQSGS